MRCTGVSCWVDRLSRRALITVVAVIGYAGSALRIAACDMQVPRRQHRFHKSFESR